MDTAKELMKLKLMKMAVILNLSESFIQQRLILLQILNHRENLKKLKFSLSRQQSQRHSPRMKNMYLHLSKL